MNRLLALTVALLMLFALVGCGEKPDETPDTSPESATEGVVIWEEPSFDPAEEFTDRDFKTDYDIEKSASIQLKGDTAVCASDAVVIDGSTVTIRDEGTYVLSGELTNGMIVVDSEKTDKTQLVLDGVTIHGETSAAIYIRQSDKVFLTLKGKNTLSNGGGYTAIDENNIDAVIFSKEDLTVNGAGSLTVNATAGHGIVSKDSLTVTGGVFEINAASHGITAKDNISIADGEFTITAGKDGVHAENADDATLGSVYIQTGSFEITAEGDGISAAACLQIDDGSFSIIAGGGSENGTKQSSDAWGDFPGGRGDRGDGIAMPPDGEPAAPPELPGGSTPPSEGSGVGSEGYGTPADGHGGPGVPPDGSGGGPGMPPDGYGGSPGMLPGGEMPGSLEDDGGVEVQAEDSTSIKGIKAGGILTIRNGVFTLDTADDGVHSNASININGGSFSVASGDDGFHADESLTVTAGVVMITESYEGLEGLHILISGGEIDLVARDDGLNAAGGVDQSGFGGDRGNDRFGGLMGHGSSDGSIEISGGTLRVRAFGDGIDANGTLQISGGYTTVCGPTGGDTATLDYDVSAEITGGTFIGTGAAQMAQTFSNAEQGLISLSVGSQAAETVITVTDEEGNVILTHAPELEYNVAILSSETLIRGKTYTVTIGDLSGEFTAE